MSGDEEAVHVIVKRVESFSLVVLLFLAFGTCLLLAAIPTKAADVTFVEYGSNPVYDLPSSSDKAYYPCVLYDASQVSSHGASYYYKMWYGDGQGQFEAVTYSNDGISWSAPVQTTGILASGYHAKIIYIPGGYSAAGGTYYYKISYGDSAANTYSINALRTADSTDGENWQNDQVLRAHLLRQPELHRRGSLPGDCNCTRHPSERNCGRSLQPNDYGQWWDRAIYIQRHKRVAAQRYHPLINRPTVRAGFIGRNIHIYDNCERLE